MNRCLFATLSLLLLTTLGCGGNGPMAIHGTVTVEGQPLERGRIEFEPCEIQGPVAAAEIADGKYEVSAMAGKKVVRITGGKVIGQRPFTEAAGSPVIEDIKPLVGAAYNTESTLRCDVTRGQAAYDFALKASMP